MSPIYLSYSIFATLNYSGALYGRHGLHLPTPAALVLSEYGTAL